MGDVDSIGRQLLFQFLHPVLQLLYLLLPAFPSILFRKGMVDVKVVPELTRDQTMSLVDLSLHILILQAHLHDLLVLVGAVGTFLFLISFADHGLLEGSSLCDLLAGLLIGLESRVQLILHLFSPGLSQKYMVFYFS